MVATNDIAYPDTYHRLIDFRMAADIVSVKEPAWREIRRPFWEER
jgi:hypothetical protein